MSVPRGTMLRVPVVPVAYHGHPGRHLRATKVAPFVVTGRRGPSDGHVHRSRDAGIYWAENTPLPAGQTWLSVRVWCGNSFLFGNRPRRGGSRTRLTDRLPPLQGGAVICYRCEAEAMRNRLPDVETFARELEASRPRI